MMTRRKFLTGATAAGAFTLMPRPAKAEITGFANRLAYNLQSSSVGAQFTIADKYGAVEERYMGFSRMPNSGFSRPMTAFDKFNVASVSKTVTAAAMLRALYDNPSISLSSPFAQYLPSHWVVDSSLMNVTFQQLLQHMSGLREEGHSYGTLKAIIQDGVDPANIGKYKYVNTNFSLMRLLIPRVINTAIPQIPSGASGAFLQSLETTQAAQYASAYRGYVQQKVWDKTGASNVQCKPDSLYPALSYKYPTYLLTSGDDFGDWTNICGAAGWNINSTQIAIFLRTLHTSQAILPTIISNLMVSMLYGYDAAGTTRSGVTYFHKGGYFPASKNDGEIHTYAIGFSNGTYVGLVMNSQVVLNRTILDAVLNAFDGSSCGCS